MVQFLAEVLIDPIAQAITEFPYFQTKSRHFSQKPDRRFQAVLLHIVVLFSHNSRRFLSDYWGFVW